MELKEIICKNEKVALFMGWKKQGENWIQPNGASWNGNPIRYNTSYNNMMPVHEKLVQKGWSFAWARDGKEQLVTMIKHEHQKGASAPKVHAVEGKSDKPLYAIYRAMLKAINIEESINTKK